MFRYEISFTPPGTTRMMKLVVTGSTPWEAVDTIRRECGDIKVLQTCCL